MLRIAPIFVLGLLLGASDPPTPGGWPGQDIHETQSTEHHENAQTNQRGTQEVPFVTQIQQPKHQGAIASEAKGKSEWNTPEGWTAGFTGGLFIATTVLWVFTALLWWSTRHTAKAIVENERPWIGPQTVATEELLPNHEIKTQVVISNSGNTPAQKMRVAFTGCILPTGEIPALPDTSNTPAKALFPNVLDYYVPFAGHILSTAEHNSLVSKTSAAWIIVRIDYFDGIDRPHYTNITTRWDCDRKCFVPEGNNDAT